MSKNESAPAPTTDNGSYEPERVRIRINRLEFAVTKKQMYGHELLGLVNAPEDTDLFRRNSPGPDIRYESWSWIPLCDGLEFFTAPRFINCSAPTTDVARLQAALPLVKRLIGHVSIGNHDAAWIAASELDAVLAAKEAPDAES